MSEKNTPKTLNSELDFYSSIISSIQSKLSKLSRSGSKRNFQHKKITLLEQLRDTYNAQLTFIIMAFRGNVDDLPLLSISQKNYLKVEKVIVSRNLTAVKQTLKQLNKSYKPIIRNAVKTQKKELMRIKVQDPSYYKKYGKKIPESFNKLLNKPLPKHMYTPILELAKHAEKPTPKFWNELKEWVKTMDPLLDIKASSNRIKTGAGYYEDFRLILSKIDTAKIKMESPKGTK